MTHPYVDHGNRHQRGGSDPVPPPPLCASFAERSSTLQSIPDNTVTSVEFDFVTYEYGGDWVNLGSSTTDITVPETAMYVAQGRSRWGAIATTPGERRYLTIQGSTLGVIASHDTPSIDSLIDIDMNVVFAGLLPADEVLHLRVLQDSAGARNLAFGSLSVVRVAEYAL